MSPVGSNSSLSNFLASLTEGKEVTTFEIISDNARPSQDSLKDLHFSPEPKETKCRWKNLVRMDSDDDMMRWKNQGGSTLRGRKGNGAGRKSISSPDRTRPAVPRVSSDPLLMPRRRLSPERVTTGNRNSKNQYFSRHGQSGIRKGTMVIVVVEEVWLVVS